MKIQLVVLVFLVAVGGCMNEKASETEEKIASEVVATNVKGRFPSLLSYEVDSMGFPRSFKPNKEVYDVPSKDWTSGFFPGNLLFIYQLTGDETYLAKAEQWIPFIEKEKYNAGTHDMGFKVFCSYGNAHRINANPRYAKVIVEAAKTLITRYEPNVGCIKSWDFGKDKWTFPVIIDNMMNLELLFEATKLSGDSMYHNIAVSHANTTLKNHFRSDNSSYHVIDYDPHTGELVNRLTHQGLHAESSWARGQGWGIYGFTMAYRYTRDLAYLSQAIAISKFLFNHPSMPEDLVPYWDLDDPNIPDAPRDASAAAVIASALLELATYDDQGSQKHLERADQILASLGSIKYVLEENTDVPFILTHSTGNMPKNDEIDAPIVYADYYFLEALLRTKR